MGLSHNSFSMEEKTIKGGNISYEIEDENPSMNRPNLIGNNNELFKLKILIFSCVLKNIIRSNSIFTPLNGIKEFLNTLALVDKECYNSAIFLGWNNAVAYGNSEPRFLSMVKCWFVDKEILAKNKDSLNEAFKNELALINLLNKTLLWFRNLADKDQSRTAMIEKNPDFFQEQINKAKTSSERVAQFLIAGANPNVQLMNGQFFIFFILDTDLSAVRPLLNKLIPLTLLRKVSLDCYDNLKNTPLICVAYYPKLLKMLLEYDDSNICYCNHYESALIKAVAEDSDDLIESVELLLQHQANPHEAVATIVSRYNPEDGDLKAEDYQFSDTDIHKAQLAFIYGADINDLLNDGSINSEILQKLLLALEYKVSLEPFE